MTEYGVQTNNIFDLLNAADEAARPAAAKARTKKSQGAKPAGGQQAKKDQGGAKPAPRPKANATTVTVSGGRGSARGGSQQPAGGNAPVPTGRSSPAQGKPAPKPALARGTEEFVRRHDESHVSFADDKGKANTSRNNEGAPVTKHKPPARGREFDRHSGTGRTPTENKKGGAGQANWGTTTADDEIAAAEDVKAELAAESSDAQKQERKNKKKKKKGKKGAEEEEEKEKKDEIPDEQLKTFDDFLKEKATKTVKLSLPPARAAGEGVKADPKWAEAVKREDQDEVFVKPKEEPKQKEKEPEEVKKPSKSSLRKKRKKEAKEREAQKLAEQNIATMFDFSARKENDFPQRRGPRGGPREGGNRGPREGSNRGPREGGNRGPREGGNRGPREGGNRGPREGGNRGGAPRNVQPKKYNVDAGDAGPQFDASAFPALQVGPPPITVD